MSTWWPSVNTRTDAFMKAFLLLCKEHGMAPVPTYEAEMSFHDPMYLVPLDEAALAYITERIYCDPEQFGGSNDPEYMVWQKTLESNVSGT